MPFATRVAAILAEQGTTAGTVVGLYGPWGDGKTTLLRFVETKLHLDQRVAVVWFNPWFYSSEAQIFEDFLNQVARALGVKLRKKRERAGKIVQERIGPTGEAVSVGTGPVRTAGSVIGAVGGLLGNPTLRTLRDRLAKVLEVAGTTKHVVVLMDDIDRLDVDQIATVFRMIKLAADFPRLSFLLAFDPEVVAQALSARYPREDRRTGTAFLEKIVQVPLSVPKTDPSRVASLMTQWLADIILAHCPQLSFDEAARLGRATSSYVWPYITTLRSGKRLLSTIRVALPLMPQEVNPVDQVLLEALRLLFPDLYTFAAHNKSILVNSVQGGQPKDAIKKAVDEAIDASPSVMRANGIRLLQELFPRLDAVYGNRVYNDDEIHDWLLAKRVCSASHFDRYFGYGLPVGDILDADIDAVFTTELGQSEARLAGLVAANGAELVVQKLFEQSRGRSADSSAAVGKALVRASSALGEAPRAYTLGGLANAASQLVTVLLRNLPAAAREDAARHWLQQADPWFAAVCLRWFQVPAARERPEDPLLSEPALAQLGTETAERFAALEPDKLFTASHLDAGLLVYGVCLEYGRPHQATAMFEAALAQDPDLLRTLLSAYIMIDPRLPFLDAISGQGYARLTAVFPAEMISAAIAKHFPTAAQKAQATLDMPPGSPLLRDLMTGPDGQAISFLTLHRRARSIAPAAPATIFEPSGTRPVRLNNLSPRSHATTYSQQQPHLVVRAAALRPADAVKLLTGAGRVSRADDGMRENVLIRIVDDCGLWNDLAQLCASRGMGELPTVWTYHSEMVRETSILRLESSSWSDAAAPALRAEVTLTTGRAAQDGNQPPIDAVMGCLDITLRLSAEGPGISLTELRNVSTTAVGLFKITEKAGKLLMPPGEFRDGEGALWIVTNQSSFDQAVDLGSLEKASDNPGPTEVWVNTTLPLLDPADSAPLGARLLPRPAIGVAVEAVRQLLQGSNRRAYEPHLHDLLNTGAPGRST